ncbi:hypothetical protein CN692_05905 [Bacillus sp. AFS002410]|nr:hypothetical protein CN692_05905 [Bacillus sp. AFS002410]
MQIRNQKLQLNRKVQIKIVILQIKIVKLQLKLTKLQINFRKLQLNFLESQNSMIIPIPVGVFCLNMDGLI